MFFFSLRTTAFRNLTDSETLINAQDVFLIGENGQGKTNFLEAIYFCCYGSSFRGVKDSEMACNGHSNFAAAARLTMPVIGNSCSNRESYTDILLKYEKGKKTILINEKKAEDRKELLSLSPCIVFCHEDMDFVSGTPERRRWFFDQTLSLYDPVYLDDLRRYRQVLKFRNAALKNNSLQNNPAEIASLLDVLDVQLVMYGIRLMEKRAEAVTLFSEILESLYSKISGINNICVQYIPSWKNDDAAAALAEHRSRDIYAGLSLSGPHRDRYVFSCMGNEFAGKASTGQRRLLALLLRAAQARRFSEMTGKKPMLLLDDVLLELDGKKRQKFISVLPDYNQAFFTFLPEEPFKRYQKNSTLVYNVNKGVLM